MLYELRRGEMLGGDEGSFFGDELEEEIGMLLREPAGTGRRQEADDRERELNMYRSGSAPPTVEGSLSAIGGLFSGGGREVSVFPEFNNGNGFASEEELRSHPGYLSYYYSNVNLNPRLPPPLLSKEDWRFTQRLKGGSGLGGIGDRRRANGGEMDNGGSGSFFAMPPGFDSGRLGSDADQMQSSTEWCGDGLIGLPGLGLRDKQKSFVEIFQDDLGHRNPVTRKTSRPASRNALNEDTEAIGSAEAELAHLRHELASSDASRSGQTINGHGLSAVQNAIGSSAYTYAAAVGNSLSRSTTPDPQLVARAPSPCPTPIGGERGRRSEKRSMTSPNQFQGSCANTGEAANIASAFSALNLSSNAVVDNEYQLCTQIEQNVDSNQNCLFGLQGGKNHIQQHEYIKKSPSGHFDASSLCQSAKGSYSEAAKSNKGMSELNNSSLLRVKQVERQKSANPATFSYLKRSPTSSGLPAQFQDSPTSSLSGFDLGGYSANPGPQTMIGNHLGAGNIPPLYENVAAASAIAVPGTESMVFGGSALQSPFLDPVYLQHLKASGYATQVAGLDDPYVDGNYVGNSYMNLIELQKAYLLSQRPHDISMGGKSGSSNYNSSFYGDPVYGMSYPGSNMLNPLIPNSPVGLGSPLRHNDLSMRFPSGMRNLTRGVMGPWHLDAGYDMDESFPSTLLEQFKSNKTKCIELSEISGHVVEFSTDQFGSRFIQQKLETATAEEKSMVYQEIMPHALALMTDVFGNYVVQKFFEHGLPPQRRELAINLFGHVLSLSLQMYGCRVIQKAIEVVDLDQKIRMVQELDGHIMRCVRDQNGNHVIQKCIECVPEENIQFIISTFFDQFVTLSTHPYGCRVIQRVLEHCKDPETQDKVMDEILGAVSRLAQDQYGNYVIQHVLEHGKPHERSAIIKELSGNIVQMSQQKFASNVVEKCLAFGGPTERQLLVNEMLGSTDENEPLQAMMKDQFANYVVQKVLETCDDQQREHILSRIKVHLNALKKYTYGKHIVARVEKLVAAGERRMAAQFQHTA